MFVEMHAFKQRLYRKKPHTRWSSQQMRNTPNVILIFNRHSKPDVRRPVPCAEILARPMFEPFGPLSENLKRMVWRTSHRIEHALDESLRNIFVKQIRHRIHKNAARFLPPQ